VCVLLLDLIRCLVVAPCMRVSPPAWSWSTLVCLVFTVCPNVVGGKQPNWCCCHYTLLLLLLLLLLIFCTSSICACRLSEAD
jgi:hypothetical protein